MTRELDPPRHKCKSRGRRIVCPEDSLSIDGKQFSRVRTSKDGQSTRRPINCFKSSCREPLEVTVETSSLRVTFSCVNWPRGTDDQGKRIWEMQKVRNFGSGPLKNEWCLPIEAVPDMLSSRHSRTGAFWMLIFWTIFG